LSEINKFSEKINKLIRIQKLIIEKNSKEINKIEEIEKIKTNVFNIISQYKLKLTEVNSVKDLEGLYDFLSGIKKFSDDNFTETFKKEVQKLKNTFENDDERVKVLHKLFPQENQINKLEKILKNTLTYLFENNEKPKKSACDENVTVTIDNKNTFSNEMKKVGFKDEVKVIKVIIDPNDDNSVSVENPVSQLNDYSINNLTPNNN
jgi:hypothetical protein